MLWPCQMSQDVREGWGRHSVLAPIKVFVECWAELGGLGRVGPRRGRVRWRRACCAMRGCVRAWRVCLRALPLLCSVLKPGLHPTCLPLLPVSSALGPIPAVLGVEGRDANPWLGTSRPARVPPLPVHGPRWFISHVSHRRTQGQGLL